MRQMGWVLAVLMVSSVLASNPGLAQAETKALSQSQDPAHLGTVSALPVKVTAKTDTILVLYRQTLDGAATTGTAGDIQLTFYTAACAVGGVVTVNLTSPDIDLGSPATAFIKTLFGTTASGVILGKPANDADVRWQMSSIVVDGDLGITYEQLGYPALVKQGLSGTSSSSGADSVWAGFSAADFVGYYIQGSGFTTTTQFVCPPGGSALATAMIGVASLGTSIAPSPVLAISVYDDTQTLLGTLSNVPCQCFTENPSGLQGLMALNANVVGTFRASVSSPAVGWRVIVLTTTGGNLWIDGRIPRVTATTSN